jgi:hypothetical protein
MNNLFDIHNYSSTPSIAVVVAMMPHHRLDGDHRSGSKKERAKKQNDKKPQVPGWASPRAIRGGSYKASIGLGD